MKKGPAVVVGVIVLLATLLGVMMFIVGSEDDDLNILSSYNNMNSTLHRPISVEEVIRQLENEDGDDEDAGDDDGTSPKPVTPTPTPGPNPTPPGPEDGEHQEAKMVQGNLQYIPQGDWWGDQYVNIASSKLGGNGSTVQQAGCYFCSLSMIAAFYTGNTLTASDLNKVCVNSSYFTGNLAQGNKILSAYGCSKTVSGDNRLSLDEVRKVIDSNNPLIIHFTGATDNGYYTGNGHFAVCAGYSDVDKTVILYDPGKGPGSKDKKLTYDEFKSGVSKGIISMRIIK